MEIHGMSTTIDPKSLRNPHLDATSGCHLLLPTIGSLMPIPFPAPLIMRFCILTNTGERADSAGRVTAKLTEVQFLAITSDRASEPLVRLPAASPP